MKVLQKLISLLLLTLCVSFHSCGYDDEELWNEVNKLQERIEKLEDICTQTNANISSIQTLLDAMKQNYSISSITPLADNKGYTITFTNNKSITLYNGVDGKDGNDGEDGKDGENGKDGTTPQIGVKDLGNGYYAWTLNGEVLTDNAGNPLHVNGKDGVDGEDGKDGEDGTNGTSGSNAPTPQLKTGSELVNAGVNGNWDKTAVYISVNGGMTWTKISASGTNPLFADVDTSKNDCVVFTLADGTTISVPRTDKVLELLYGEWIRVRNNVADSQTKIIFNKDFTYQEENEGVKRFEYLPKSHAIVLSGYSVLFIKEISSNTLVLQQDGDFTRVYYKTIPVTLSQTEVNAPKEGGTFYIDVQTEEKLQLKDITSNISVSTPSSIYFSYEPTPMSATYELKGEKIEVQVEATTAEMVASKEIGVFNERGYFLAKFTIKQQGALVVQTSIFSVYGKSQIANLLKRLIDTHSKWCNTMDLSYTNMVPNNSFNAPLLSNNSILNSAWADIYQTNARINELFRTAEQEQVNGPVYAPLQTLSAMLYYQLVKYWGDVPYIKVDDDPFGLYPRTSVNEIFSTLTANLISAITTLEEKKNDNSSDIEKSILFSKDVARMALAHIYMYQGKHQEALPLLKDIVKNGFYSLEASKEYTDIHNKEVIFAQTTSDNTFVPIYTYTDVILSLAECEMYANNTTKAMEYIQQVADKKGITITESDTKQALKEVYKATLANYGGYFAFLKRNGLAMTELGLTSEDYLLFPIPEQEIMMNPNLIQNPGY